MNLHNRTPDIENIYAVLRREVPSRPTLFELFLNKPLYERLAGRVTPADPVGLLKHTIDAFAAAGYDYTSTVASDMLFNTNERDKKSTVSLNEGFVITDEASFEAFKWPNPEDFDYSALAQVEDYLPGNMKLMVLGPCGVLENAISIVGYENLCYMLYEDPDLAQAVFDEVGSRLLKYYEIALQHKSVGLVMLNDDWGFKTQTFLSTEHMRQYVLPWHKKIVELANSNGLPAILHSCGNLNAIMDDVIGIGIVGKHSYEDNILPVEDSYERWHDRIAILGGIDVDFLIRKDTDEVKARCDAMLERTAARGGWAMGTGNSVPEYIPQDKYLTMIKAALNYAG